MQFANFGVAICRARFYDRPNSSGLFKMNENTNIKEKEDVTENVEMTAGEMLRNARTTGRRKREIPTISKQLCIREEFLQALESGDYSEIPEPVYILGFARNYAMELGLDPDEIVSKIKREMGISTDCTPEADGGEAAACAVPHVTAAGVMSRVLKFLRARWKWFAAGGAVLAAVVLAVIIIVSLVRTDSPADVANAPVALVHTVTEPTYNKEVRERFGAENRDSARIILQSVQESWVKVEDARGNTVFSRVLVPGDVYYVPSGTGYKATFGNAGGVDIWVDGKAAAKAGPAHTRKSGIELDADALAKTAGSAKADEDVQPEEASAPAGE